MPGFLHQFYSKMSEGDEKNDPITKKVMEKMPEKLSSALKSNKKDVNGK